MKRISFREDYCIGCGLCDVHCLVEHSQSKDILKAFRRELPKAVSRIRVDIDKPYAFAVQCQQCEDPLCVAACLSGAMHIDQETGLVIHEVEKCLGCWTCIMVCPYSAISMDSEKGKAVAKCDLCPDLDTPACVLNCPNEALIYSEVSPVV